MRMIRYACIWLLVFGAQGFRYSWRTFPRPLDTALCHRQSSLFALQTNIFHDLANSNQLFELLYSQLKLCVQVTGCQYGEICLYTNYGNDGHERLIMDSTNPPMQLACSYVREDIFHNDIYLTRNVSASLHHEIISMPLAVEHREYGLMKLIKPYTSSGSSDDHKMVHMRTILEMCRETVSRALDMELRQPMLEQQLQLTMNRESFVHGRVVSCLQSLRTLTRLVGKRLKKDDLLGHEIVENIAVQTDEIDQATSLLAPMPPHTANSVSVASIMDSHVVYTDVSSQDAPLSTVANGVYSSATSTARDASLVDVVDVKNDATADCIGVPRESMPISPANILDMEELLKPTKEETEVHLHPRGKGAVDTRQIGKKEDSNGAVRPKRRKK